MLKIQVRARPAKTRTIKYNDRSGKASEFEVQEQECLLIRHGDDVPDKFTLPVAKGEKPYEPGVYTLKDSAFSVDQFGRLTLETKYGVELEICAPERSEVPASGAAPTLQRAVGTR